MSKLPDSINACGAGAEILPPETVPEQTAPMSLRQLWESLPEGTHPGDVVEIKNAAPEIGLAAIKRLLALRELIEPNHRSSGVFGFPVHDLMVVFKYAGGESPEEKLATMETAVTSMARAGHAYDAWPEFTEGFLGRVSSSE